MIVFCFLRIKRFYIEKDKWLRQRISKCIWKSCKKVKTGVANVRKCGALVCQAYLWENTCLVYWCVVKIGCKLLQCLMINSVRLVTLDNVLPISNSIQNRKTEQYVRWFERTENESRKKNTSFSSYSIVIV